MRVELRLGDNLKRIETEAIPEVGDYVADERAGKRRFCRVVERYWSWIGTQDGGWALVIDADPGPPWQDALGAGGTRGER